MHCCILGSICSQPGMMGCSGQLVELGSKTTLHPGSVGVALQLEKLGSTTLHPIVAGLAMHWVKVGSIALQPIS